MNGAVTAKTRTATVDEGPRADTTIEALARLRPVFAAKGSVTAGNSSQTSDGAGALILASEKAVRQFNLQPLARFVVLTSESQRVGKPAFVEQGVEVVSAEGFNTLIDCRAQQRDHCRIGGARQLQIGFVAGKRYAQTLGVTAAARQLLAQRLEPGLGQRRQQGTKGVGVVFGFVHGPRPKPVSPGSGKEKCAQHPVNCPAQPYNMGHE